MDTTDPKLKSAYALLEHMKGFTYKPYKENGTWYIQSPDKLEKTKLGVCHDFSLYAYYKLTKLGYKCNLIYITNSSVTKTHSFVIFTITNKWYWFEPAFSKYIGIHEGRGTYKDGIKYVVTLWSKEEHVSKSDIAINDRVKADRFLTRGTMFFNQYLDIVTEPFKE